MMETKIGQGTNWLEIDNSDVRFPPRLDGLQQNVCYIYIK